LNNPENQSRYSHRGGRTYTKCAVEFGGVLQRGLAITPIHRPAVVATTADLPDILAPNENSK
jgi:hypothetical protein